jgi:serine/threonine-protein kinase
MGMVVAARHLELRERVAIKFLVARGGGKDAGARFVREGRAAMRIRSEHVVRVYDIGALETGERYLVMEYLDGRDLAATLAAEGPLPVEAAVEHVLQAIEAIAEAHAMGIVHRDLKPSNLFLTRRADGSAVVKVLDFGVAKETGPDRETATTEPGGVVGTPAYMAPEQMRAARAVDARTDVWALGATLYALVTGGPPFPAGSVVEMHERAMRGAPPLRAARPDAPGALEAIVQRCLAPDPGGRYASVAELADALAEIAPERARISAERAARILSARPPPPDHAPAGAAGEGPAPDAVTPQITGAPAAPSWRDGDTVSPTEPSGEGAAGGSRSGASPPVVTTSPRRSAKWKGALALGVAGVAAVLVALVAIPSRFAGGSGEGAPPRPPVPPTALVTSPAPAPTPALPGPPADAAPIAPSAPLPSASAPAPARRPALALPPRTRDPLADPD